MVAGDCHLLIDRRLLLLDLEKSKKTIKTRKILRKTGQERNGKEGEEVVRQGSESPPPMSTAIFRKTFN